MNEETKKINVHEQLTEFLLKFRKNTYNTGYFYLSEEAERLLKLLDQQEPFGYYYDNGKNQEFWKGSRCESLIDDDHEEIPLYRR